MKWLKKVFGAKIDNASTKIDHSTENKQHILADAQTYIEKSPQHKVKKILSRGQASVPRFKRREVRVFISSTFQDMQAERDHLVKKIFPELRKMCMDRGVGFTEVDFRWGVTQEQVERGEVLAVCFNEIENCHPYFIGLLGARYGGMPDAISEEIIQEHQWFEEYRGRSFTELEIVHGVLNNLEMAEHAFFYFRNPASSEPVIQNKESIDKLTKLKERIRLSGFPVRENYCTPDSVGKFILQDLKQAINKDFPAREFTSLERDRLDHEMFAESRAHVYVGRDEYFQRLNEHAASDGAPLVVLGESGVGKSTLLANWGVSLSGGSS